MICLGSRQQVVPLVRLVRKKKKRMRKQTMHLIVASGEPMTTCFTSYCRLTRTGLPNMDSVLDKIPAYRRPVQDKSVLSQFILDNLLQHRQPILDKFVEYPQLIPDELLDRRQPVLEEVSGYRWPLPDKSTVSTQLVLDELAEYLQLVLGELCKYKQFV